MDIVPQSGKARIGPQGIKARINIQQDHQSIALIAGALQVGQGLVSLVEP